MPGEPASWTTDLDEPDDPQRLDLVESKPRGGRTWQRRWIVAGIAVAVALGAIAWYADGRRRATEFDRLAGCVAAGESARADADTRVTGMGGYVRPSLGVNPAPEVDQSLYRLVAREAEIGAPEVRRAQIGCEQVGILPIHRSLENARTAYVAYLGGEADRLAAIAADGSHAFDGSDEVVALHAQAFTELKSAAPDDSARRRLDRVTRVDQ